MPFKPGQSGNPKGGKKKGRRLSKILEQAGGKEMLAILDDGTFGTVIPEEHLADMLWGAAVNKVFRFKSGKSSGDEWMIIPLGFKNWLNLVKFLYKQIDGAPGSTLDVDGEIRHTFSIEEWEAKRMERLSEIAKLPDVDNTFSDNVIVDIKARDSDEATVSKYDNVSISVKED